MEARSEQVIRLGGLIQRQRWESEKRSLVAKCFGEFMGTLVLVLLGDGVVANVWLKRSKAGCAGWMVIASAAFAVMAGVSHRLWQ